MPQQPASAKNKRMRPQPYAYQVYKHSCWPTTIMNGLLFVYGSKSQIPFKAHKLVYSVLEEDGVHNSADQKKAEWEKVVKKLKKSGVDIKTVKGKKVEAAIQQANFSEAVIACDVNKARHTLLLTGKEADTYFGFDPNWDSVKSGRRDLKRGYERLPELSAVDLQPDQQANFSVKAGRFFQKNHGKYALGPESERYAIIMTKQTKT